MALGGIGIISKRPSGPSPAAKVLERALAADDLTGLATVDVTTLVQLLGSGGSTIAPEDDLSQDGSLKQRLVRIGIDPSRDIDHAILARYGRPHRGFAIGLLGRFSPLDIERALRKEPDLEVIRTQLFGETIWRLTRFRPESCEPATPLSLHITPTRLIVGSRAGFETL